MPERPKMPNIPDRTDEIPSDGTEEVAISIDPHATDPIPEVPLRSKRNEYGYDPTPHHIRFLGESALHPRKDIELLSYEIFDGLFRAYKEKIALCTSEVFIREAHSVLKELFDIFPTDIYSRKNSGKILHDYKALWMPRLQIVLSSDQFVESATYGGEDPAKYNYDKILQYLSRTLFLSMKRAGGYLAMPDVGIRIPSSFITLEVPESSKDTLRELEDFSQKLTPLVNRLEGALKGMLGTTFPDRDFFMQGYRRMHLLNAVKERDSKSSVHESEMKELYVYDEKLGDKFQESLNQKEDEMMYVGGLNDEGVSDSILVLQMECIEKFFDEYLRSRVAKGGKSFFSQEALIEGIRMMLRLYDDVLFIQKVLRNP